MFSPAAPSPSFSPSRTPSSARPALKPTNNSPGHRPRRFKDVAAQTHASPTQADVKPVAKPPTKPLQQPVNPYLPTPEDDGVDGVVVVAAAAATAGGSSGRLTGHRAFFARLSAGETSPSEAYTSSFPNTLDAWTPRATPAITPAVLAPCSSSSGAADDDDDDGLDLPAPSTNLGLSFASSPSPNPSAKTGRPSATPPDQVASLPPPPRTPERTQASLPPPASTTPGLVRSSLPAPLSRTPSPSLSPPRTLPLRCEGSEAPFLDQVRREGGRPEQKQVLETPGRGRRLGGGVDLDLSRTSSALPPPSSSFASSLPTLEPEPEPEHETESDSSFSSSSSSSAALFSSQSAGLVKAIVPPRRTLSAERQRNEQGEGRRRGGEEGGVEGGEEVRLAPVFSDTDHGRLKLEFVDRLEASARGLDFDALALAPGSGEHASLVPVTIQGMGRLVVASHLARSYAERTSRDFAEPVAGIEWSRSGIVAAAGATATATETEGPPDLALTPSTAKSHSNADPSPSFSIASSFPPSPAPALALFSSSASSSFSSAAAAPASSSYGRGAVAGQSQTSVAFTDVPAPQPQPQPQTTTTTELHPFSPRQALAQLAGAAARWKGGEGEGKGTESAMMKRWLASSRDSDSDFDPDEPGLEHEHIQERSVGQHKKGSEDMAAVKRAGVHPMVAKALRVRARLAARRAAEAPPPPPRTPHRPRQSTGTVRTRSTANSRRSRRGPSLSKECVVASSGCHCGRGDDGRPMVGCDGCRGWYHLSCIGVQDEGELDEQWFCDACVAGADDVEVVRGPMEANADDEDDEDDEDDVVDGLGTGESTPLGTSLFGRGSAHLLATPTRQAQHTAALLSSSGASTSSLHQHQHQPVFVHTDDEPRNRGAFALDSALVLAPSPDVDDLLPGSGKRRSSVRRRASRRSSKRSVAPAGNDGDRALVHATTTPPTAPSADDDVLQGRQRAERTGWPVASPGSPLGRNSVGRQQQRLPPPVTPRRGGGAGSRRPADDNLTLSRSGGKRKFSDAAAADVDVDVFADIGPGSASPSRSAGARGAGSSSFGALHHSGRAGARAAGGGSSGKRRRERPFASAHARRQSGSGSGRRYHRESTPSPLTGADGARLGGSLFEDEDAFGGRRPGSRRRSWDDDDDGFYDDDDDDDDDDFDDHGAPHDLLSTPSRHLSGAALGFRNAQTPKRGPHAGGSSGGRGAYGTYGSGGSGGSTAGAYDHQRSSSYGAGPTSAGWINGLVTPGQDIFGPVYGSGGTLPGLTFSAEPTTPSGFGPGGPSSARRGAGGRESSRDGSLFAASVTSPLQDRSRTNRATTTAATPTATFSAAHAAHYLGLLSTPDLKASSSSTLPSSSPSRSGYGYGYGAGAYANERDRVSAHSAASMAPPTSFTSSSPFPATPTFIHPSSTPAARSARRNGRLARTGDGAAVPGFGGDPAVSPLASAGKTGKKALYDSVVAGPPPPSARSLFDLTISASTSVSASSPSAQAPSVVAAATLKTASAKDANGARGVSLGLGPPASTTTTSSAPSSFGLGILGGSDDLEDLLDIEPVRQGAPPSTSSSSHNPP